LVIAASVSPRKRGPRRTFERKTVASIGLDLPARIKAVDAYMRYLVCECVCSAVQAAALSKYPVAYRGVVSVGHFSIEGNFMLGPAVDEAAGLMELADGAFVWLAPSAGGLSHILRPRENDRWDDLISSGDVPLKDGRSLSAELLNPFAGLPTEKAKKMRRGLLDSMKSSRLDVIIKRQNTRRFFQAVARAARLVERTRERERARTATLANPHAS
jgi:hypothetical protein